MKFAHFPRKSMVLMAGDVGIVAFSYLLSMLAWFGLYKRFDVVTLLTGFSFLVASLFIFYLLDSYNIDLISQRVKYLFRHAAGVVITAGLLALYFFFRPDLKSGRGVFLLCLVLAGAGTYYWRLAFLAVFKKRLTNPKKLLIIGEGRAGEALLRAMKKNPDYRVLGLISDDSSPLWQSSGVHTTSSVHATLRQMSRALEVNVLVLADSHFRNHELLRSALDCKLDGVTIYDMPTFYEKTTGKVPVEHVTDSWLVFTPLLGVNKNVYNNKLKRALDFTLSLFGLVLTLPLALVVAAMVKLDSPGPALYRQRRVGLNGRIFTLLKFRSMVNGKDHDRQRAGKKNDPRITRVGKIIRMFRMDEIPQLWNVLKGDLSFIGPRALVEEEVGEFESKIPYFSLRHSIRPGITGWAQINYRHGATIHDGLEKLQYDLFYIKNLSPFLDFLILLKTVKVVLSRKGAR